MTGAKFDVTVSSMLHCWYRQFNCCGQQCTGVIAVMRFLLMPARSFLSSSDRACTYELHTVRLGK